MSDIIILSFFLQSFFFLCINQKPISKIRIFDFSKLIISHSAILTFVRRRLKRFLFSPLLPSSSIRFETIFQLLFFQGLVERGNIATTILRDELLKVQRASIAGSEMNCFNTKLPRVSICSVLRIRQTDSHNYRAKTLFSLPALHGFNISHHGNLSTEKTIQLLQIISRIISR